MENVQLHWHILWIIENPTAFVHSTYSIRLRLVHRQSNSHEFCWKLIWSICAHHFLECMEIFCQRECIVELHYVGLSYCNARTLRQNSLLSIISAKCLQVFYEKHFDKVLHEHEHQIESTFQWTSIYVIIYVRLMVRCHHSSWFWLSVCSYRTNREIWKLEEFPPVGLAWGLDRK